MLSLDDLECLLKVIQDHMETKNKLIQNACVLHTELNLA